ncbi:MAG: SecD/SecF family protein translocase subunit, partial [Clostridia bacterium]|nr:SecD/SecF family protein translocase subunit [Clostridia bacterium]
AKAFKEATTTYLNDFIGIYLDDVAISWPTVNSTIDTGEAVIEGDFDSEAAQDLASKINAGALPYAMTSSNYSAISATMGSKALTVMLYAGLVAAIFICLLMLITYRLPGFVACINLLLQLCIQLLIFSNFGLTITLPGIAGVILSIGMSVDSNVIIAERIREEMRKGKSVIGAIDTGYGRALTAIIDCNITTVIVALLLIFLGTGSVLSFGYTLLIGIILNFFVSVLVSKQMLRSLSSYNFLKNPKLYGYKEVRNND